jgi:hypothetical protein
MVKAVSFFRLHQLKLGPGLKQLDDVAVCRGFGSKVYIALDDCRLSRGSASPQQTKDENIQNAFHGGNLFIISESVRQNVSAILKNMS